MSGSGTSTRTRFLVTGSTGHLGEALVRTLRAQGHQVVGLDVLGSPFTTMTGSIADRRVVRQALRGVTRVLHAAALHKPHIGSQTRQDFVDTNVTGTLTLLEEAAAAGVCSVVFTSSTSAFGWAFTPPNGQPAAWTTGDVIPRVRNIYGATNLKVNEFLYRRVDLSDVLDAHLLAAERAPDLRFGRYIISATTPFTPNDLAELAVDAPAVAARLFPDLDRTYRQWGLEDVSADRSGLRQTTSPAGTWAGRPVTTFVPSSSSSALTANPAALSRAPSGPRATTGSPPGSTPLDPPRASVTSITIPTARSPTSELS